MSNAVWSIADHWKRLAVGMLLQQTGMQTGLLPRHCPPAPVPRAEQGAARGGGVTHLNASPWKGCDWHQWDKGTGTGGASGNVLHGKGLGLCDQFGKSISAQSHAECKGGSLSFHLSSSKSGQIPAAEPAGSSGVQIAVLVLRPQFL